MTITITTQEVAELVTQMPKVLCAAKAQAALTYGTEASTATTQAIENALHEIWGDFVSPKEKR